METKARLFLRVSTDLQTPEAQISEMTEFAQSQGLEVDAKQYLAHGKSAFHGKHLPVLAEALEDMRAGEYSVLVFYDSSRMSRMGAASAFSIMQDAREAGGRVLFAASSAQHLNVVSDWSPALLAIQATLDQGESARKSDYAKRTAAEHRKRGSASGRGPALWTTEGPKNGKRFVPTERGRDVIPRMIDDLIAGDSAAVIGERYDISPRTVLSLIRNPLLHGQRRNGGNYQGEELISYDRWLEAQRVLSYCQDLWIKKF